MHISASPVRQLSPHLRVPESAGVRISAMLLDALAVLTFVYLAVSLLVVLAVVSVVAVVAYAAVRIYEILSGRRAASAGSRRSPG